MPLLRTASSRFKPVCSFLVHVADLPPLPNGARLELDRTKQLRSFAKCLVEVRPRREDLPADERAPAQEVEATALPEDLRRGLANARFVVEVELLKPGRSVAHDVVFVTELADAVAREGGGVVRDLAAQRVFLPGAWRVAPSLGDLDPRRHVTVHVVTDDGSTWIHTHGLVKFGRAELEVYDVAEELLEPVGRALLGVAAYVIDGGTLKPRQTLGERSAPVQVRAGGRDLEHWGETPVLELVGKAGFRAWSAAGA